MCVLLEMILNTPWEDSVLTYTKQLFPGFNYSDPSGFAGGCSLTGITLSNGRHLGNLGACCTS